MLNNAVGDFQPLRRVLGQGTSLEKEAVRTQREDLWCGREPRTCLAITSLAS